MTPYCVESIPGTLNQLEHGETPVRYGLGFLSLTLLGPVSLLDDLSGLIAARLVTRSAHGRLATSSRWIGVNAPTVVLAAGLLYQFSCCLKINAESRYVYSTILKHFIDCGEIFYLINILYVAILLCYFITSRSLVFRRLLFLLFVVVVLASAPAAVDKVARGWHREFARYYDDEYLTKVFTRIEQVNRIDKCICVLDHHCYPFFGSRRQKSIYNPFYVTTYESLLMELRQRHVTLVAARIDGGPPWGRYHDVDQWLSGHPNMFHEIERGPSWAIYEVDLRIDGHSSVHDPDGKRGT